MPDWVLTVVVSVLTSGVANAAATWLIQQYFLAKIKHDLDLKLEAAKPLTAEETLRRQNNLNSKRDAFFEAISLVNRHHAAVEWSGPDIPSDRKLSGTRPTESEVNTCYAKLCLFSKDPQIPIRFFTCFGAASAVSVGEFVSLLRQELGYGELPFSPEFYTRFFGREPGVLDGLCNPLNA